METKDVLLAMYTEQTTQARQHEDMRATAANLIFGAGALVAGWLFKDADQSHGQDAFAIGLIFIGLFGALISAKHYERNRYHVAIARSYRRALEELLPESKITALRDAGACDHTKKHPLLSAIRLNWMWNAVSLLYVFAGVWYLGSAQLSVTADAPR